MRVWRLGSGEHRMSRRECPVRPGPAHQFATDLRALRAGTGLTYRALARRAGYSYSTLSAAASGEALPTLEVTLAYVGACGGDMAAWEQRWHALAAKPNGVASLLRRVALLSAAVIAFSTLAAVREIKQSREQYNDFTNEFAIADAAIQDEFSQ